MGTLQSLWCVNHHVFGVVGFLENEEKVRIAEVIKKMNIFLGLMKKIGRCIVVCFHPVEKNSKNQKWENSDLVRVLAGTIGKKREKQKETKNFSFVLFIVFFYPIRVVKKNLMFQSSIERYKCHKTVVRIFSSLF